MRHHEHFGEPKFSDIADSDLASYTPDICTEIGEPLPDVQSDYRAAAQSWMARLRTIDEFMSTSSNPRLAWITIAITFDLTSIRDLTETEIATQLGVSPAALRCATAEFKKMAGLDPGGIDSGESNRLM